MQSLLYRFSVVSLVMTCLVLFGLATGVSSALGQSILETEFSRQAQPSTNPPPLHQAALANDVEALKALLEAGNNVGEKDPKNGWTALHYAAHSGSLDAAALLIERKASVNIGTGSAKITALQIAAADHHPDIVQLLIAKGADVHAKSSRGMTPLHYATIVLDRDATLLLLANGANPAARIAEADTTPLNGADLGLRKQQEKAEASARAQVVQPDVGGWERCARCDGTGRRSEQEIRQMASASAAQVIPGRVTTISPTCPTCYGRGSLPDAARRASHARTDAEVSRIQASLTADAEAIHNEIIVALQAFDPSRKQTASSQKLKQSIIDGYKGMNWKPSGSSPDRQAVSRDSTVPSQTQSDRPSAPPDVTNARRIVYLCDASGSMQDKFASLRTALKRSVGTLAADQSFTVIFFAGDEIWAFDKVGVIRATDGNKNRLNEWVDQIAPKHSTNPVRAIRQAFAFDPDMIHLVTDGFDQMESIDLVMECRRLNRNGKVIVNCVEISTDASKQSKWTNSLEQISRQNGGHFQIIGSEDLEKKGLPNWSDTPAFRARNSGAPDANMKPVTPATLPAPEQRTATKPESPLQRPETAGTTTRPASIGSTSNDKPLNEERATATIILWNTHNHRYRDRGTTRCDLTLYSDGKAVWSKKAVEVPWNADRAASVTIPTDIRDVDRLRVDITDAHGRSAGLAEIEVLLGKTNIARDQAATTDGRYDGGGITPASLVDGVTEDAGDGKGYWLHDRTTGWVEIALRRH